MKDKSMHTLGRITNIIAIILIFAPPIFVSIYYNVFPPLKNLFMGIGMVSAVYLPIAVAEFITFTPMVGTDAAYLVFVTGNLSNLKIPCALTCIENSGYKQGSEEATVISTIAIAVSSIVTTIIIAISLLLLVPLTPVLSSEVLKPAFAQIIPALFGALAVYWLIKSFKLALIPLITVISLFAFIKIPVGVEGALIPVIGLISVVGAKILYKKGIV